jgi:hypothetical protein
MNTPLPKNLGTAATVLLSVLLFILVAVVLCFHGCQHAPAVGQTLIHFPASAGSSPVSPLRKAALTPTAKATQISGRENGSLLLSGSCFITSGELESLATRQVVGGVVQIHNAQIDAAEQADKLGADAVTVAPLTVSYFHSNPRAHGASSVAVGSVANSEPLLFVTPSPGLGRGPEPEAEPITSGKRSATVGGVISLRGGHTIITTQGGCFEWGLTTSHVALAAQF